MLIYFTIILHNFNHKYGPTVQSRATVNSRIYTTAKTRQMEVNCVLRNESKRKPGCFIAAAISHREHARCTQRMIRYKSKITTGHIIAVETLRQVQSQYIYKPTYT